jgi:Zn-finger nucleic acid-binding protein
MSIFKRKPRVGDVRPGPYDAIAVYCEPVAHGPAKVECEVDTCPQCGDLVWVSTRMLAHIEAKHPGIPVNFICWVHEPTRTVDKLFECLHLGLTGLRPAATVVPS